MAGFFSRAGYAASRLVVIRSDKGNEQFNISELAGNLAGSRNFESLLSST
jgi:hypothetical protein